MKLFLAKSSWSSRSWARASSRVSLPLFFILDAPSLLGQLNQTVQVTVSRRHWAYCHKLRCMRWPESGPFSRLTESESQNLPLVRSSMASVLTKDSFSWLGASSYGCWLAFTLTKCCLRITVHASIPAFHSRRKPTAAAGPGSSQISMRKAERGYSMRKNSMNLKILTKTSKELHLRLCAKRFRASIFGSRSSIKHSVMVFKL